MTYDLPVVLVRFLGARASKPYAYYVPPWVEVEKHDIVIVEVRDTVSLARVVSTNPAKSAADFASAFVVGVVDIQAHKDKLRAFKTSIMETAADAS